MLAQLEKKGLFLTKFALKTKLHLASKLRPQEVRIFKNVVLILKIYNLANKWLIQF